MTRRAVEPPPLVPDIADIIAALRAPKRDRERIARSLERLGAVGTKADAVKELLTVAQAATYSKYSQRHIWRFISASKVTVVRTNGGVPLIDKASLFVKPDKN